MLLVAGVLTSYVGGQARGGAGLGWALLGVVLTVAAIAGLLITLLAAGGLAVARALFGARVQPQTTGGSRADVDSRDPSSATLRSPLPPVADDVTAPTAPRTPPPATPPAPHEMVTVPYPAAAAAPLSPIPSPDSTAAHSVMAEPPLSIEPEQDAVVQGSDTWIRWTAPLTATGQVRWRRVDEDRFRTTEAERVGDRLLAHLEPLVPGNTYEYVVDQRLDDRTASANPRRFAVSSDIVFEQPLVEARVARDYDQRVPVVLRNTGTRSVRVAVRALGMYEELPADVVGRGSADEPVELAPGASLTLELAVTAPDAKRQVYEIPIEAAGASSVVRVRVDQPDLKLSFRVLEQNPTTLAYTFEVQNDGATVGDLSVTVATSEEDEVRLEPTAGHAYLPTGKALRFTASPVLYLEFERSVAQVECRAAGQLRTFPLEFTAPPGRHLIGVRVGCQHHSHAFDWICTNRPRIVTELFGPDCLGEEIDEALWWIHLALDAAGAAEFLGPFPDAINASIYCIEGDWANAGMSAIAMIPAFGTGATLSKYGVKITREAAERLGKEGLEAAIRAGRSADVADALRRAPSPTHPRSVPIGPGGAARSLDAASLGRRAGAGADVLGPRASAAAGGVPPSHGGSGGGPPGGGRGGPDGPPGGPPRGGGPIDGGTPFGGDRPRFAGKSAPDAPGQRIDSLCMECSRDYVMNWNRTHPGNPPMALIPENLPAHVVANIQAGGIPNPARNPGPGMFDPMLEFKDGGLSNAPTHSAVRNTNGSIYDPTILNNMGASNKGKPLPSHLEAFREYDTFDPDTYADLLNEWSQILKANP